MLREQNQTTKPNFFISRAGHDSQWAQWIAQELEHAGYTTYLQDWDFLPGQSFVENMVKGSECERTILVLSPEYLESDFTRPEWQSAFARDSKGNRPQFIPIRIRPCSLPSLLVPYIFIDFVGLGEHECKHTLLTGVAGERLKKPVNFPSGNLGTSDSARTAVEFPGVLQVGQVTA